MNETFEFIEAGLPNIKGYFITKAGGGSFVYVSEFAWFAGDNYGSGYLHHWFNFDASQSSPIYKDNCNTVQPPAYTVMFIMKIKA